MKLLLLIFISVAIQAKSNTWKPLKHIDEYPPNAFNLKNGVEFIEVRQYRVNEKNEIKETKTVRQLHRAPINTFSSYITKQFRRLAPNFTSRNTMHNLEYESIGVGCHYRYNGFMIDSNKKMWRTSTIEDIISFLGKIDTPAEAQAILWLREKNSGSRYRKTSKGYEVIIKYEDDMGLPNTHCKKHTYKAIINNKGQITKYKLLKSQRTNEFCITEVHMPACEDYLVK